MDTEYKKKMLIHLNKLHSKFLSKSSLENLIKNFKEKEDRKKRNKFNDMIEEIYNLRHKQHIIDKRAFSGTPQSREQKYRSELKYQREVEQKRNNQINMKIKGDIGLFNKNGDEFGAYIHSIYKRALPILDGQGNKCYEKLIKKAKNPKGMNKTNFSSFVFVFYYMSFIDDLAHDYDGLLSMIEYMARTCCETNLDNFIGIFKSVLESLNHNILCR
jgi:hypothetical protein